MDIQTKQKEANEGFFAVTYNNLVWFKNRIGNCSSVHCPYCRKYYIFDSMILQDIIYI